MATKEQAIVAEPDSSPVSLSMCFEQHSPSANPIPDVDLAKANAVNGGRAENASIQKETP
jgi:hypothetical protein